MAGPAVTGINGAVLFIIALNAGAAIYVADLAPSLQAGIDKALSVLNSGEAHQKLDDFVRESTGC